MATPSIIEASGLGKAVTPEQWAAYVLEHLSAQSVVLASGATRVDTAMKVIHVPRVTSDGTASWYGELEEITADGPQGDDLVLTPRKCGALVRPSNESVEDSGPAVLDVVGTAMTRAVALEADRAILAGTGGKQPTGVLGQAGGNGPGAISIDALINASGLVGAVGGVARAAYLNPADWTALQLSKDSQGRPLLESDYRPDRRGRSKGWCRTRPRRCPPAGVGLRSEPSRCLRPQRSERRRESGRAFHFGRRGREGDREARLRRQRRARVGDDRDRRRAVEQVEQLGVVHDHLA